MDRRVASGCLVFHEGNCLLLRRSALEDTMQGLWEMPAGKIESNLDGSPRENAIRETFEEAGITLGDVSPLGEHLTEDKRFYGFLGVSDTDVVELSFEHDAYEWIPTPDILDMVGSGKLLVGHHTVYFLQNLLDDAENLIYESESFSSDDIRINYNSNCPACISIQALIGKEKLETDPANTYWDGGAYQKEVEHLQMGVWPCSDCEGRGVNCMACIGTGMVFLHAPLLIGGVHEKLLSYAYMLLHDYNNNGNGNILELGVDEDCYECGGTGERDCYNCDGGTMDCYRCDGTGEIEDEKGEDEVCSDCDGTGEEDCSDCGGEDWCVECGGSGEFWNENLIRGIKENYQDAIDYIYANANDSQVRYALNQLVQGLESGQLRTTSGMEMFNEANKKLYNDLHDALIYYVINTPNRPVPDIWQDTHHHAESFVAEKLPRGVVVESFKTTSKVYYNGKLYQQYSGRRHREQAESIAEWMMQKLSQNPRRFDYLRFGAESFDAEFISINNPSKYSHNYVENLEQELKRCYEEIDFLKNHVIDEDIYWIATCKPDAGGECSISIEGYEELMRLVKEGIVEIPDYSHATDELLLLRGCDCGITHEEWLESRNNFYDALNASFEAESTSKPHSVTISRSSNSEKKLMAVFEDSEGKKMKTTHFGQRGASDYTKHGEKERMERYLDRHGGGFETSTKEDWKDPTTAGALSRWILWNKPSLSASFTDFKKRFNLKGDLKVKKSAETFDAETTQMAAEEYNEDNQKMQEAANKIMEILGEPDSTFSNPRGFYASLGEPYFTDMVYVLEYEVLTNEGSSMGQRMARKLRRQGTEPWSDDRWTGSPDWPTYAAGPFHLERETFNVTVSEANPAVESIVMDLYQYFADKYGVNETGFEPAFTVARDEAGNEVTADDLEIDTTWRDSVQGFESEETFGANSIGSLNHPNFLRFKYWKTNVPRLTYEEYLKANKLGYGLEKLIEIDYIPEPCKHENTSSDDVYLFEESYNNRNGHTYYQVEIYWECPDCSRLGGGEFEFDQEDNYWGTDPSMYCIHWLNKTREGYVDPFTSGSWSSVFGAETFEAPMNSLNQRRQIPITTPLPVEPYVCFGEIGSNCGNIIEENEEWLITRLDGTYYVLCNTCVDNSPHFYLVCNACGDRFCDEELYDDGTAEDQEIEELLDTVICNNCAASDTFGAESKS